MFKRVLLAIAVLGMVSAPVSAELIGGLPAVQSASSLGLQQINPGHGTIGVLNTLGTFASSNAMIYPNSSDIITVTFGIHQPYVTPLLILANRNALSWDSTEVVILGVGPAGPFVTNNIGTTPAAGAAAVNGIVAPISGTEAVVGISGVPASPFVFAGSSTTPFLRVTFHATGPFSNDGLLDLFAPSQGTTMTVSGMTNITQGVGLIFRTFTSTISTTTFGSVITNIFPGTAGPFIDGGASSTPSFGVELKPEPASAALLGMGVLAMTGGFWRRRRQQA